MCVRAWLCVEGREGRTIGNGWGLLYRTFKLNISQGCLFLLLFSLFIFKTYCWGLNTTSSDRFDFLREEGKAKGFFFFLFFLNGKVNVELKKLWSYVWEYTFLIASWDVFISWISKADFKGILKSEMKKKKDQTELVSCFNSMILHMHALTCFKVLFIGGCFIL